MKPPSDTLAKPSLRWKELLKIFLAFVLIGIIFSKTSLSQIVDVFKEISWTWLLISFVLFFLTIALKGLQYWALFECKIPYLEVVKIVVLQNAFSNLVTNTAGVATYFTLFRVEQDVNFKRSGIVFLFTKIGDLFSMGIFLLISTFSIWKRVEILHQLTLILLVGVFSGLFVFLMVVFSRDKLILLLERAVDWLHLGRFEFVSRTLNLLKTLAEEEQGKIINTFLLACALSMIYMSSTMVYAFSRILAFRIPIDFWSSTYMVSFMQFVSLIPIQILGGLGVSEFVTMYFFDLFGVVQLNIPATLIGRRITAYLFSFVSLLYVPLSLLYARLKFHGQNA